MKIVFIRHAVAEDLGRGKPGIDEQRRIVKRGATDTRILAGVLEQLRLRPKILFTSPLVRARQTAEIIAENVKRCPDPIVTEALAPDGDWAELRREIARHGDKLAGHKGSKDAILFAVGHQPNLTEMILEAMTGEPATIEMEKSTCIGLSWNDDKPLGIPSIFLALDQSMIRLLTKA